MPFQKAIRVSPVYQDEKTGQLLLRLTDAEGKVDPDAVRYETEKFQADGKAPTVAYFVPLDAKPAPKPAT